MRLRPTASVAFVTAVLALPASSYAQPMDPVDVPRSARERAVPAAPGVGAQAQAVLAFFHGFPSDLRDARDLLDGRSLAPAFNAWCGLVPYVDFTNGTVLDSLGREAPSVACLPFLDPMRMAPPHSCQGLSNLPTGNYYQGGGLALRVRGLLAFRAAGAFTFAWGHDDGVGFSIGDTPVFEFRDPTGSRVDRRVVRVAEPGLYPFTLEWYDTVGGALIDWYIADGAQLGGPFDGARFHLVPREDLYPSGALPCTATCARCPGSEPVCEWSTGRCLQCQGDDDCGPCRACAGNRCVPVGEVPGADGGAACAPDAATPDADTPDADTPATDTPATDPDAPLDGGGAPPQADPGCGCRAGARARHGLAALAALAALATRRRRR